MLFIVYCRTKVRPTEIDSGFLSKLGHPMYTTQVNDNGDVSAVRTAEKVQDFFLYNDQTDIFEYNYNPIYDFTSPFYFFADNC